MSTFIVGHATHPDWRMALGLVAAQLDAQAEAADLTPTLGWCYFSDHHAASAEDLLDALRLQHPGVAWTGGVGVGVCASGVEYLDEPAVAVMLCDLPREQFRVFSGRVPLPPAAAFPADTALVHADPSTPDLGELIVELSERVDSGYLFGGLASSRTRTVSLADGVFAGGLSGVAFDAEVGLVSRVTQGCQPVGPARAISEADRNVVYALGGEPAFDCLLRDLGLDESRPREVLPQLRSTLVGLSDPPHEGDRDGPGEAGTMARRGAFGADTRVRHLVGVDAQRRGLAIAEVAQAGQQLAFCRRDVEAARRDLMRIGAEIRSELEPEELPAMALAQGHALPPADPGREIAGALYVSCTGRGGPHFGAPSAELQLLRHALGGDVPLIGFFAAGEIGHHHLYGYTGVLTVFTRPAVPA